MRYKIVFADLDGTLLNSKREISENTKQSILKSQAAGLQVVINSGRMPKEIDRILESYGLNLSYIALNGAYIYDCKTQNTFSQTHFDSHLINYMLELNNLHKLDLYWYTKEKRHFAILCG